MRKLSLVFFILCYSSLSLALDLSQWQAVKTSASRTVGFGDAQQALKPQCVQLLSPKPHELFARSYALNMADCQHSQFANSMYYQQQQQFLYFTDQTKQHYFMYKLIGRATNGLYVLETTYRPDDQHIFRRLQIVKQQNNYITTYAIPTITTRKPQRELHNDNTLSTIAIIDSGKTCHFSIAKATLSGNRLSVSFMVSSQQAKQLQAKYLFTLDKLPAKAVSCYGLIQFSYNLQSLANPEFQGFSRK